MNSPLISIIMPAYNVEKYIVFSIESVVNQTYTNWELFVIDDKSSDNTKNIVEEFIEKDTRINLIAMDENSGKPSVAKNAAIKYMRGEYIAFLDSDDLWLETKLERQLQLIQKDDFSLCYTGGYLIDENTKDVGCFMPKYNNGYIFKYMLRRYEINNQSVLVKSAVFRKFNENITIGEDYNLFMEIVFNNKVCNIKDKLVKYRLHSSSITKSKTKDLSEGTLYTLSELNHKYEIMKKYFFSYVFCWLKAARFKI